MVTPSTVDKKSRFWLYLPFILLLVVVAGWTAYWFIAKSQIEKGLDEWIGKERASGAVVEYSTRSLGGYPFRFELDVADPVYQRLAEPRWEGERLRVVMQPWNWNHIMAFSPGRNLVTDQRGLRHTLNLDTSSAASLSWDKTGLKRMAFQMGEASGLITGETYETTGFSLNLAPRPGKADDMMYSVQWESLTLNGAPRGAEYLGDTIGPSRLIGEVRDFYPAWLRSGANVNRLYEALAAEEGAVEVAQLLVDWGPLDLGAKGDLSFEDGRANGSFGVRIENADDLRAAMRASGDLGREQEAAILMMETASADGQFLTFTIKNNEIRMGPIVLGRVPGPRP